MSNSNLSCMRVISPNRNSPRNHKIDAITIHCVVGQMGVEALCNEFSRESKGASCNYGIGYDGRIGTVVDEEDRSWCTSSGENDNRAITIECASDAFYPYAINANVWKSLIELCADICKRNGIKKLVWSTDKYTRMNHLNGCNLTVHRDYENKSCPGDYIYSRLGQIAKEVNQKLSGAPAGPFKPYQGQVNADDGLNCRTAPVSGSVLKTYLDGTVLAITKEEGSWGYCGEGWVCLDYINKAGHGRTCFVPVRFGRGVPGGRGRAACLRSAAGDEGMTLCGTKGPGFLFGGAGAFLFSSLCQPGSLYMGPGGTQGVKPVQVDIFLARVCPKTPKTVFCPVTNGFCVKNPRNTKVFLAVFALKPSALNKNTGISLVLKQSLV